MSNVRIKYTAIKHLKKVYYEISHTIYYGAMHAFDKYEEGILWFDTLYIIIKFTTACII